MEDLNASMDWSNKVLRVPSIACEREGDISGRKRKLVEEDAVGDHKRYVRSQPHPRRKRKKRRVLGYKKTNTDIQVSIAGH
jgi:hypothetical protein